MMYISKITGRIAPRDQYGTHQLVWRFFDDPDADRHFLYRHDMEPGHGLRLLVVSERPPSALPGWSCLTKPYRPVLRAGQVLEFSLRANPVVKKRSKDGRQQRHDVIMDAMKSQGVLRDVAIQEQGRRWLDRRAEQCGFRTLGVRTGGYSRHETKKGIIFSTLDYDGGLEVTDPDRLTAALRQGIGPAKSFGCGLMLLRRL